MAAAKTINLEKAFFADLMLAIDPVRFAQSLGLDPDPWQRDLLLSTESRVILNCSRQSGKSTITAILALHHALNEPGALVLVLSPSLRQSGELFKKIMGFYKDSGKPIASETETALTMQLHNKSRIVSLPGKEQTVRGFSGVSLLIVDEAARVDDELYYAVRPMLAVSQGRMILLSTPFGRRGFFFNEWTESEAWKKIQITAYECPRIASSFLDEERLALGDWHFKQEYLCEFSENVDAYFSYEEIQAAISSDVKPFLRPDGTLDV
jgi:phage terminase large subunit-like protein